MFKLSLNSLLNKTFLSDYCQIPGIYVPHLAMCLRCGGIFNDHFITGLLPGPLVIEFW